jgi:glycosyltransferase involved in cell wall biosynthesis
MSIKVPSFKTHVAWSVIIPIYNRVHLLHETLCSVLAALPLHNNRVRLMVVDDASTDGDVLAVINQLGIKGIEYHRNPTNLGLARNLNQCVALALEDSFVHLLNADDLVDPLFYATMDKHLYESGAKAIFCNNFFLEQSGHLRANEAAQHLPQGFIQEKKGLFIDNYIQCASVCVHTSVYQAVGGFDARFNACVDWHQWKVISTQFNWFFVKQNLCTYRLVDNSHWHTRLLNGENYATILKSLQFHESYLGATAANAAYERQAYLHGLTILALIRSKKFVALWPNMKVYFQYPIKFTARWWLFKRIVALLLLVWVRKRS